MTDIITIGQIRQEREERLKCRGKLATIPYYIKPNGEIQTRAEHMAAKLKKEDIERAAHERL
jgi:hypothetical protein